ncbi:MAG: O-antigen ligase family protein [Bacteroidetes bacterium]|nr:O-antigen ligase family protein [Bacteroidota bacterium]
MSDLIEYILLFSTAAFGLWLLYYNKEWFYSFCVFIIPLSVGIALPGGANISFPGELMLAILALIILWQIISKPAEFKKIIFHPVSLLIIADLIWMITTSLFSELPVVSFKRVIMRGIFIASLFLFTIQWAERDQNKIKLLLLYAFGLILPICYTEFNHFWIGFDPAMNVELSKPFFSEHTIYGAAIAFVIPFIAVAAGNFKTFGYTKLQGILLWFLLAILIFAEYFSFSRAGLLSLILSSLLYGFMRLKLKFKHLLFGLFCILILTFIFRSQIYELSKSNTYQSNTNQFDKHLLSAGNLNTNVSNLERVNRWKCAVRMFLDKPVTGFGPGTFQFEYGTYQMPEEMTRISTLKGDKGNAHSELLTSLSEQGLPGFLINLAWILTTIGVAMRSYYQSENIIVKKVVLAALLGFTTFVFHGLFNSFLDQDKIAVLVFGTMAIIVASDLTDKIKTDEKSI